MSTAKKLRKRFETLMTRLALLWVPRWSRRSVVRMAWMSGTVASCLPIYMRRVARANLDLVYGDELSRAEKNRILRGSCRTFALVMLDLFWYARDTRQRIQETVIFDPGLDEVFSSRAQMCITAHLGNWELLGHAVSIRGFPLSSVAAPLVNPAVDEYLAQLRTVSGQIIIPQEGALRGLLRTLKSGGKVALLLDQNTRPEQGGVFVDFFGLPVPISDAGAALAIKTGADILFGFCIPDADGNYYVHSCPKLCPAADQAGRDDILKYTQAIAKAIEQAIREHPEAWLWMYKRWKHVPDSGTDPRWPFYAKKGMPVMTTDQPSPSPATS